MVTHIVPEVFAYLSRSQRVGEEHLGELRAAFASIPKQPRLTSKPVNAVRKYNGRELSRRMIRALDEGRLSTGDFCREVCLNNISPGDIEEFRRGLR